MLYVIIAILFVGFLIVTTINLVKKAKEEKDFDGIIDKGDWDKYN